MTNDCSDASDLGTDIRSMQEIPDTSNMCKPNRQHVQVMFTPPPPPLLSVISFINKKKPGVKSRKRVMPTM